MRALGILAVNGTDCSGRFALQLLETSCDTCGISLGVVVDLSTDSTGVPASGRFFGVRGYGAQRLFNNTWDSADHARARSTKSGCNANRTGCRHKGATSKTAGVLRSITGLWTGACKGSSRRRSSR